MSPEAKRVLDEAMQLSANERETVAELLQISLERTDSAEIDLAWEKEIQRRLKEVEDGTAKLIPWEEVRDSLLKRVRQ